MTERDFAFLTRLSEAAAAITLPHFRSALATDNKAAAGAYDPVTVADRGAEQAIRALITAAFPDDGIYGEEFGVERADAEHVWIIDPIDGTRAFLAGLPIWGTLVGLVSHGRPAVGMMAQPFTGELFLGDGRSAVLHHGGRETRLRARTGVALDSALMMSTSPRLFKEDTAEAFERVASAVRDVRFGGDCYAYSMVAAGQVDLVIETGLQAYDVAALIPIVEGAGGVMTTWDGGTAQNGGRIIAAGSAELHAAALKLLAG